MYAEQENRTVGRGMTEHWGDGRGDAAAGGLRGALSCLSLCGQSEQHAAATSSGSCLLRRQVGDVRVLSERVGDLQNTQTDMRGGEDTDRN